LDEEINKLEGDITNYNPEPNSINLPVDERTDEPQKNKDVLHTLEEGKKKKKVTQLAQQGSTVDRKDNKHLPKGTQVHKPKTKKPQKHKDKDFKKEQLNESVNLYLLKTSRHYNIGVRDLENYWKESKEELLKVRKDTNTRGFWEQVKRTFDNKVNGIFLEEAKRTMSARQKLTGCITKMVDHIMSDRYIEAKEIVKEATSHCLESMICEHKVNYQKQLAEEISKKLKDI
jgi:hypothetical protein